MISPIIYQFLSLHHILHLILFLVFFLHIYPIHLRPIALSTPLGEKRLLAMGYTFFTHEQEVIGMVLMSFLLKLKKCRNFHEVVSKAFIHTKVLMLLLAFLVRSYVGMGFLVVCFGVMMVVLPPPKISGDSTITLLNTYTFSSQIRDNPSSPESHIVLCSCDWCHDCHFVQPIYNHLSVTYDSSHVSFYQIDCDKYPELAEELNIDISTQTKQLPTLILFYQGREVRRLPAFKEDGSVERVLLDKKGIITYFELDKELDEKSYLGAKQQQQKQKSKKKS